MNTQTTLVIKGLVFYGYHGALEQEKILGGKYEIDLYLTYNAHNAAATDELHHALNYQEVVAHIIQWWNKGSQNLLESMASGLIQDIKREFPVLEQISLFIRKYAVPLGTPLEYVEIRQNVVWTDEQFS